MSEPTELAEFVHTCVEDWFINVLAPTIERRLDASGAATLTWCPQSRWFWQHCAPMLAVFMDAKVGPLCDCKPDGHRKYHDTTGLPFEPAPAGYWGSAVAAIA